ncbi:hypothetical protein [Aestuariivivens sediminicola]|uniref:hypothetical protein n=1 Tax=Aestuariivivens sediminicola TaxID=2913560 RepID=UPI001F560D20|nr:hypothetical protein [Aestuariivivens sediminicola]
MKTAYRISALLLMAALVSWAQSEYTKNQIHSLEIKLYKANVSNDQVIKGDPIYKIRPRYPISGDFNTGKIEYDPYGRVTAIYYPNNKGDYHIKDTYTYNEKDQVVKAKMTLFELQDSIILNIAYDSLGRIEKTRWNKHTFPVKGWLHKLFYKYWSKDLTDEDYHRYYLSYNDSLNQLTETEFNNSIPKNDHYFELRDAQGNLLKEKYRYIDTTQMGPLQPKIIDTITVLREYQYTSSGLLKTDKRSVEKRSLQKGLPNVKSYDKSIVTFNYTYNDDDKVREEIKTVEQLPSKSGFIKIKGSMKTFRRVHEYPDNGKKHIVYTYDDKGNLEYSTTRVYGSDDKLIEYVEDYGKRKSIDRYNERGDHTVHIVLRKNKKISESTARYTYNDHGDWTTCLLYHNQKDDPLYFLVERTIVYY